MKIETLSVILHLILSEPTPEFRDPADCVAPYIEPRPGHGQKNSCGARGLKATGLVRLMNNPRVADQCVHKRNFDFCGFTREGKLCNELQRVVTQYPGEPTCE